MDDLKLFRIDKKNVLEIPVDPVQLENFKINMIRFKKER
jgi:hypothetical protein